MDVLLSLPIVSYFLAPTVTSWSTSLNLLFFYMTWTTLVLSHSPLRIELMGVFGLRVVFWLIPSLLFLAFDTLVPSLAEGIKLRGAAALPPRDPVQLGKLLLLALANLALETALEGGISILATTTGMSAGPLFKTSTTLPLPWQIIKQIALLMAAREGLTYYIHRHALQRNSRLGSWHRGSFGHHRRAPPFSLLLFADHPVPFLLHRFLPIYLPALALQPHLLTYFMFVALVTVEETMAMSGYSVVPGIIMGGIARRTTVHYVSGEGNYGAWGFLDWIHGTSLGKDVMADFKDEAEKHQLKERGENAASSGLNLVQDGIDGLRRSGRRTRKSTST
jgi:hypothetical protein